MELASVPAVSMAVIEAGELAWARAIGVRHARSRMPADDRTMFEAASLSKPAVAYVAMLLRAAGRLDLDRPLADVLAPADVVTSDIARRVTARHVLSHSSGFRNWRGAPDRGWAPTFEPGSRFQYSGEGFVWLARVMERITGTGFVELMRTRLFAPAGLDASTFLWHAALADRMATGHGSRGDPVESTHVRIAGAHHRQAAEWNRPAGGWAWDDVERAARAAVPDREPLPVALVPNAAASLLTTPSEYGFAAAGGSVVVGCGQTIDAFTPYAGQWPARLGTGRGDRKHGRRSALLALGRQRQLQGLRAG
jgi:CubicO group peptidase (beta-lactamase class C family)